jgi:O-antigen/teichoic acid export membrane protein
MWGSRPERLTSNALALMANTAVTSVLGVAFWAVAARLWGPAQLGEDAGLVAAMMLLSSLSELSLGQGIPRLLPQLADRRRLAVLAAYGSTGAVALVLATAFVVVAPILSPGFAFLGRDHWVQIVLVGAVVLWNVFALQDAVFIALRKAVLVPVENGVFGLVKLALMMVLLLHGVSHGVLLAWLLGMAVVVAPVNWLLFVRLLRSPSQIPTRTAGLLPVTDRGRVTWYLAGNWAAGLLSQGASMLLPVLVLGALGSAASAYFYTAFTIAGAVGTLALALSTVLVVEGAHNEAALSRLAAQSLVRVGTLLLPIMVVVVVGAPLLLWPFGAAYSSNGTTVLRLLVAGCVPQALVIVYQGMERVRGRAGRIVAVQGLVFALILLGLTLPIPYHGLMGIGIAWLLAWTLTALAVLPALYRVVVTRDHLHAAQGT